MSKSEANPKSEIRKTTSRAGIGAYDLAGIRRSKPRLGCLFMDGGEIPEPPFCFSAARVSNTVSNRNSSSHGADAREFVDSRAAEKQKVTTGVAGSGYKQATPTGLGLTSRNSNCGGTARSEIGPFGFRTCFEFRLSNFGFLCS